MAGPSVTDWISATSSVFQTVGALLAIGVTAVIARRSERAAGERERLAIQREHAARTEANARADEAIRQAAQAERDRLLAARKRIAGIAVHSMDLAKEDIDRQIAEVRSMTSTDEYGDARRYTVDWYAANTAATTLKALVARAEDPMLLTLLEHGMVTLEEPNNPGGWQPAYAVEWLGSRSREIGGLAEALRKA